jgi:hypothetical protein
VCSARSIGIPDCTRVANWREKTERSRVHAPESVEQTLQLHRLPLLGNVEDDQAALAKLLRDVRLGVRLDLSARRNAGNVNGPEGEGAHA